MTPTIARRESAPPETAAAPVYVASIEAPVKTWLHALRLLAPVLKGRPVTPAMACVRISVDVTRRVEFGATDGLMSIRTYLEADHVGQARPSSGGVFLVSHSWLTRTIRTLSRAVPADAMVTVRNESLLGRPLVTVAAGGFEVPTLCPPVDEHPALPLPYCTQDTTSVSAVFNGEALRTALEDLMVASSKDDTLPVLTALHIVGDQDGSIRVETTDRYRLASTRIQPVDGSLAGLDTLLRAGDWKALSVGLRGSEEIRLAARYGAGSKVTLLAIETDAFTATVTPSDGEYPKLQKLFTDRDEKIHAVYDRKALLQTAKTLADLAPRRASYCNPIRLALADGTLHARVDNDDEAGSIAAPPLSPITATGDANLTIYFNPQYLAEAVASIRSDKVRLSIIKDTQPARFSDGNATTRTPAVFHHLLMPVRNPAGSHE